MSVQSILIHMITSKINRVPEYQTVTDRIPVEIKTMKWTWKAPFHIPWTRYEFKTELKKELHLVKRTVDVCCTGYHEINGACYREFVDESLLNASTTPYDHLM